MNSVEVKEQIKKTVPVFLNGPQETNQEIGWMTCHGYGQRADFMINKWNRYDENKHRVVSLEASNRFYWEGMRDKPVATWMTSRYRLDDIRDNNDYFDQIYQKYLGKMNQKVIFGFSQGGTTMWRWIHDRRPDFDVFINYAGWMPDDIDLSILKEYLAGKKMIFVYGLKDQYLQDDRMAAFYKIIEESQLEITIETFDGDHRIERDVLDRLTEKYL